MTIKTMLLSLAEGQKVITAKLDTTNHTLVELKDNVSKEIEELKQRVQLLEKTKYDTERTLIFTGLKPSRDHTDRELLEEMMQKIGVSCQ